MAFSFFPAVANYSPVECNATFIPWPKLPGSEIRRMEAELINTGLKFIPAGVYSNNGAIFTPGTPFCNVTVQYESKGGIPTTIQVWLPTKWNGRMQGLGGSGWAAGLSEYSGLAMTAAIAQGYVAASTDGGWPTNNPYDYALLPDGKVDMKRLEHYASASLYDLSVIGKAITASYYGKPARYSYWNGCSQGGRQGMMIAQKYPNAFDGIAASAAPVNWGPLTVAGFWAQVTMHELGVYFDACELTGLTAAAIKACDMDDGVEDGLISNPDACKFDAMTVVNKTVECLGAPSVKISEKGAIFANTAWHGMKQSTQRFMWRPANYEAPFVSSGVPMVNSLLKWANITLGLADRVCKPDGTCTGSGFKMVDDWIKLFLRKDPNFDTSTVMLRDFDELLAMSERDYTEVMGTNSTDLSGLRKAGTKLISYHGLADPIIPSPNSRTYFLGALDNDPKVHDYFRHFEAPGVGHCYSASGLYPATTFDSLVRWVEQGIVPDTLEIDMTGLTGPRKSRILCPYPKRSIYKGSGDTMQAESYYCGQ